MCMLGYSIHEYILGITKNTAKKNYKNTDCSFFLDRKEPRTLATFGFFWLILFKDFQIKVSFGLYNITPILFS